MRDRFYTEFAAQSLCRHGGKICGDTYLLRRSVPVARTIAVLSDGLGHGVRANVLSTLTATMLLNFVQAGTVRERIAGMLEAMLPVDTRTGSSYATFTLADIDDSTGATYIIQYDNPLSFVVREGKVLSLEWSRRQPVAGSGPGELFTASFTARAADHLVMVTDGVTQSGQKTGAYRFGWGAGELGQYCSYLIDANPSISSSDLAAQLVSRAAGNDQMRPANDMSCAVATYRPPRQMMLVSCPPGPSGR